MNALNGTTARDIISTCSILPFIHGSSAFVFTSFSVGPITNPLSSSAIAASS